MPMELAIDLASLALYDIVIYADDSGSMAFEEGGDRINDLKLIVGRVAEVLFDWPGRSCFRSCCTLLLYARCIACPSTRTSSKLMSHVRRLVHCSMIAA